MERSLSLSGYCAERGVDPWASEMGLILPLLRVCVLLPVGVDFTVRGCASTIPFSMGRIDGLTVLKHDLMAIIPVRVWRSW